MRPNSGDYPVDPQFGPLDSLEDRMRVLVNSLGRYVDRNTFDSINMILAFTRSTYTREVIQALLMAGLRPKTMDLPALFYRDLSTELVMTLESVRDPETLNLRKIDIACMALYEGAVCCFDALRQKLNLVTPDPAYEEVARRVLENSETLKFKKIAYVVDIDISQPMFFEAALETRDLDCIWAVLVRHNVEDGIFEYVERKFRPENLRRLITSFPDTGGLRLALETVGTIDSDAYTPMHEEAVRIRNWNLAAFIAESSENEIVKMADLLLARNETLDEEFRPHR